MPGPAPGSIRTGADRVNLIIATAEVRCGSNTAAFKMSPAIGVNGSVSYNEQSRVASLRLEKLSDEEVIPTLAKLAGRLRDIITEAGKPDLPSEDAPECDPLEFSVHSERVVEVDGTWRRVGVQVG